MSEDQIVRPDPKFEAAWNLGVETHDVAVKLHEMGCNEPGYDELQDRLDWLGAQPDQMDQDDLLAYISGLRYAMGMYLW